jgi:hypothetical protein
VVSLSGTKKTGSLIKVGSIAIKNWTISYMLSLEATKKLLISEIN